MQRAVREARRAAEKGQSTLEWIQSVQRRAYSEEVAEKALAKGRARLNEEAPAANGFAPGDSGEPPTPEQVFAFLLAWQELGGTSGVAAIRELLHRRKGHLPSN